MRTRLTYIAESADSLISDNVKVTKGGLQVQCRAAREDKITSSLGEIARGNYKTAREELSAVLEQTHELHIRWASPESCDSVAPFHSHITPGLHVSWTPSEGGCEIDEKKLDVCAALKKYFSSSLKCNSLSAFTTPQILSSRFATTPNLQYYASLTSLTRFVSYFGALLCGKEPSDACLATLAPLEDACSVDISYDAISGALTARALHPPQQWSETHSVSNKSGTVEVGILHPGTDPTSESPYDITLAGILTTLDSASPEPIQPKETRFTFPSRHHSVSETFNTTFDQPTGLHPVLRLSVSSVPKPPQPSCKLHVVLTLPSTLFLDRYAFRDTLFLQSHNLTALHAISGATDLELPEWLVPQWGSTSLLEMAPDTAGATIPLHLRYLEPAPGGYRNVSIGVPVVFWACHADEGAKFAVNPFDRTALGYDGLFGDRTAFWHMKPVSDGVDGVGGVVEGGDGYGRLMRNVTVPVLDTEAATAPLIEWGTMVVVMLGFLWVAWRAVRPLPGHGKVEEVEEMKKER